MQRFLHFGYFILFGLLAMISTDRAAWAEEQGGGFALKDTAGDHLDVLLDGRVAARYMYAFDKSTPERRHETYKPYLHVFDAEGKAPITKGPGGLYTHHRGIFIGWNRMTFDGKGGYDRWHMNNGEIVHRQFADRQATPDHATLTSITHWNDEKGVPMIEETRTMTFRRGLASGRLLIDFVATLKAPNGDVVLDGDPEHAGVHYRPADEIVKTETVYVFPREKADPRKDVDYPWVGETYALGDKRYSVVQMNHPDNPEETKFSAYRDYGRFGAFFKKEIPNGQSLTVRYRFLVADGEMPPVAAIQKSWDDFAGASRPSPVPRTTMIGVAAEKPKDALKAIAR